MPKKKQRGWFGKATRKPENRIRLEIAKKGVETRRKRLERKRKKIQRDRIKKGKIKKVTRIKAKFDGIEYPVYAIEFTDERAIFPRPEKHPDYEKAPFGEEFVVKYGHSRYIARKQPRWYERFPNVICLSWNIVKDRLKPRERVKKRRKK